MSIVGYLFWVIFSSNGLHVEAAIMITSYILASFTGVLLFAQRRQATAKISWLTIIILIPFIGPLIYLIFGKRFKERLSKEEYIKKYNDTYKAQSKSIKTNSQVLLEQSKLTNKNILPGNMKFFDQGMKSFESLFKDIGASKKFIHLNYYIIKQGELWEEMKYILFKKVKEGIEVRLIMDDFGKWTLPWYELRSLKKNGIKLSVYNKVKFPFISSQDGFRTHRKYSVIDGEIVYAGGVNISDEYVGFSSKYGMWEDVVVKITGSAARAFSLLFINDWLFSSDQKLSIKKYAPKISEKGANKIIMVDDSHELDFPLLQTSLIKWILSAKKSIEITTPYLVPTPEIENALKAVSLMGVKVRIYVPGLADKKYVFQASFENALDLAKYGIEIRVINHKFLHTKAAIFDGKTAYIGTMNIDYRSMYSQMENVTLFEGPSVKSIQTIFNKYHDDSKPLKKLKNKFRPRTLIKSTILKLFYSIM